MCHSYQKSSSTPPYLDTSTQYIEATIISLNLKNKVPLIVVSTCIPPSTDPLLLTFDIEKIMQLGPTCMFGGDFNTHNTKWGSKKTTTRRKQLKYFADNAGLDIISPPPDMDNFQHLILTWPSPKILSILMI
ncbi:hypothetical protein AVEN_56777-1 [Araneus ventricosus]|uniref:Endonuclease/exonuclease/phosphatase domain-containing protein n=1 Tax=Araneus ventricosus TaxID=182803 RepID=A0A4Y2HAV8_ARAVE|nr:hypothetical protein AVEN_56777-1 [Araneus ventricosus]